MSPIRRLARPLLAAPFVLDGADALRRPAPRVADVARAGLSSPERVVQVAGVTKVLGGLLLATGRLSRLSSVALATAAAGNAVVHHPFWKESEATGKSREREQFVRELGLLGGLLVAAADTGGRESVPHAAARISRRTARRASRAASRAQQQAERAASRLPV